MPKNPNSQPQLIHEVNWTVPIGNKLSSIHLVNKLDISLLNIFVDGNKVHDNVSPMKAHREAAFKVDDVDCVISVDMNAGKLLYSLKIAGTPLKVHKQKFFEKHHVWILAIINEKLFAVVFKKETLDLYGNGKEINAKREFTDEGTETTFNAGKEPYVLEAVGNPGIGMNYKLRRSNKYIPMFNKVEDEIHSFDWE